MSSVLKESAEARTDARLLTAATQASMLAAEWSLRYDLEHAPQSASAGWQKIQNAIGRANEHAALLDSLNELRQRGRKSRDDGWFRRKLNALFNGSVDEIPPVAVGEGSSAGGGTPSVFVWPRRGPSCQERGCGCAGRTKPRVTFDGVNDGGRASADLLPRRPSRSGPTGRRIRSGSRDSARPRGPPLSAGDRRGGADGLWDRLPWPLLYPGCSSSMDSVS